MHADEVLWIIRGHQRRLEQTDDLLAHHARNFHMPPRRSKKRLHSDLKKWKFYGEHKPGDLELPEGDDDPDKVIVLEKRRREMEAMQERYGKPIKKGS